MGFFDRLGRLLRANLNDFVSKAEDPVKILDQAVIDMKEDLVKLRQAVAIAIASQNRLRTQSEHSLQQSKHWYSRAELALKKGDEDLAKESLARKKTFQDSFNSLVSQIDSQKENVEKLKRNLIILEKKISEAATKKDMLKARATAAKAQQQIQNAVGDVGSSSAMAAFERMEEKVEALEASGEASAQLADLDLESRFESLEDGDDIEKELNELRNSLKEGVESVALPSADKTINYQGGDILDINAVEVEEVNNELEDLRKSIENS